MTDDQTATSGKIEAAHQYRAPNAELALDPLRREVQQL
jgi:hypothetical protein